MARSSQDDSNDRSVGYLERYAEEGKRILEDEQATDRVEAAMMATQYQEVRRETDTDWYLRQYEIAAIKVEIKQRCGGKNAIACKTFQD